MVVPASLTLSNWDLGGEVSAWAYLHAGELFPHVEIPPGRPAEALPVAASPAVAAFEVEPGRSLEEYCAEAPVTGIVVVHRGRIVFERYPRMRPGDRHLLMSVSKLLPSVLIGLLELRGRIDLDRPVDAYLGELAGSGWAGVAVRDVLDMTSGIACLEIDEPGAYTDPAHPFFRFEAALGWRPGGAALPSAYDLVAALPAHRPPGEAYEYTSVNTFVLSWLVERITGSRFADVVAAEIWSRGGFEAPAQLCVAADGAPAAHGGLSTTLRDLARFGMLCTPGHAAVGPRLVDDEHLRRIRASVRPALAGWCGSGRQWNSITGDGDLYKGGFGGQGLYVSPARDLVIAFTGTPAADGSVHRLRHHCERLAETLSGG